jgi:hypothetical protein
MAPGTHYSRGRVGRKADLDALEKRTNFTLPGTEPGRPARCSSLYRLSYPDSSLDKTPHHEPVWRSEGIFHTFLTSALDRAEWSALSPGKEPSSTHYKGCWVCPRADLDTLAYRNISAPPPQESSRGLQVCILITVLTAPPGTWGIALTLPNLMHLKWLVVPVLEQSSLEIWHTLNSSQTETRVHESLKRFQAFAPHPTERYCKRLMLLRRADLSVVQ